MIYFIAMSDNLHPLSIFLDEYYKDSNPKVKLIAYDELYNQKLQKELVIFTDLERFDKNDIPELMAMYEWVKSQKPRMILNAPDGITERVDINHLFYDHQLCTFKSYEYPFDLEKIRFPAFRRQRYEHWSTPRIYQNKEEFKEVLHSNQVDFTNQLLVEYVDCRDPFDEGLFVKYGCFYLNGKIVPRHYQVSNLWVVKSSLDARNIEKEKEYQLSNPHKDLVKKAFEIAGISYGRIDYSFDRNNQVQIFEINTNPTLIDADDLKNLERLENTERFFSMFRNALIELENRSN